MIILDIIAAIGKTFVMWFWYVFCAMMIGEMISRFFAWREKRERFEYEMLEWAFVASSVMLTIAMTR